MQTGKILLAAFLLAASVFGAEPVKVQLNSLSVLMRAATLREFGEKYTVQVTSDASFAVSNGELEPAPAEVPYSHWGFFLYYDPTSENPTEPFILDFAVDIPSLDANANKIPDILEFSGQVDAITTGEYFSGPVDGTFRCRWTKSPDGYGGFCAVTFDFGQTFTHLFEIYEYTGFWTNAAMTGTNGTVNLRLDRSGFGDAEFLEGPFNFSIANQALRVKAPGGLKNQGNAAFEVTKDSVSELNAGKISAFLEVKDGTPILDPQEINFEDYNDWKLLITDPNDADGDGIPDLLEGTSVTPAAQPKLEIIKTQNGIRILIHGEIGRTYILEDVTALPATNWLHPMNVLATETIMIVDLPAPTGAIFWRARVL